MSKRRSPRVVACLLEKSEHLMPIIGALRLSLIRWGSRSYLWIGSNKLGCISMVSGDDLRAFAQAILDEMGSTTAAPRKPKALAKR